MEECSFGRAELEAQLDVLAERVVDHSRLVWDLAELNCLVGSDQEAPRCQSVDALTVNYFGDSDSVILSGVAHDLYDVKGFDSTDGRNHRKDFVSIELLRDARHN